MSSILYFKKANRIWKNVQFFEFNEWLEAQNLVLPLLLSRFLLYLRKKAQDAAAIGTIKNLSETI